MSTEHDNATFGRAEAAVLAEARPGVRITAGRAIETRERFAAHLRPVMEAAGILAWLASPRAGESERSYARRMLSIARQGYGVDPDAAVRESVLRVLAR